MITQAFKRWLHKWFSWWPWKSSSSSDFSQAVSNSNRSSAQEPLWSTSPEGPGPQPGITSVVVEQERTGDLSTIDKPEPSEPLMQHPRSPSEGTASPPSLPETPHATGQEKPLPVPTFEQKLLFLRYLVNHGIVNEGFVEGQVPRQYQRKR